MHIYKTAVHSLHLIYIAVLALADLMVLLVKYSDTLYALPTSALGVIYHRSKWGFPSSLYILYHTRSDLSTLSDIIFSFNFELSSGGASGFSPPLHHGYEPSALN